MHPSEDVLVCDACDRPYDRRRFLRHLAAGGALAADRRAVGGRRRRRRASVRGHPARRGAPPQDAPEGAHAPDPARRPVPWAAPRIITRAEWGADESIRTSGRAFAPIRKLVVHHTASPNNPSNPPGVVRDMYRYHVVDRGYADIGYNFVIDHRGNIYEGRWARNYAPGEIHDGEDEDGFGVMAAHAEGVNAGSCGVVLIGDFSSRQPTDAAVNALVQLLAWKASRHQIDPWDSETVHRPLRAGAQVPEHRRPSHRRVHRLPRQRAERQARRHPRLGEGAGRELRARTRSTCRRPSATRT